MNIAIIDDEPLFSDKLNAMLNQICENHEIHANVDIYRDGYEITEKYMNYHLLFLDIEMPFLNGLETAQRINTLKGKSKLPLIVFVTSKDNMVFEALKQFPYHFIRKSYLDEDIENCIVRISNTIENDRDLYLIKAGRKNIPVSLNDVLYLEKQKNYIIYYTAQNLYSERGNMDDKAESLIKKGFIRIHIGYLVNASHIVEIKKSSVTLDNDAEIPISKKFKDSVKDAYMEWLVKEYA